MTDQTNIRTKTVGAVGLLTLCRPQTLNALSKEMVHEIMAALADWKADDEIRAVVIHGEGRAFSSGYELSGLDQYVENDVAEMMDQNEYAHEFAAAVWAFPKPLIAAAHGYCLAGACEIAMLCDITVAGESCMFGEPEIRFSASSPTLIMPWVVPMKVAKELLLTGAPIDARRAYELGMVNKVVPDDLVLDEALKSAEMCAKISPLASRLTKRGINNTYEVMGLMESLRHHAVLGAVIDGTVTDELAEFARIATDRGLKAALKWRDDQFADADAH